MVLAQKNVQFIFLKKKVIWNFPLFSLSDNEFCLKWKRNYINKKYYVVWTLRCLIKKIMWGKSIWNKNEEKESSTRVQDLILFYSFSTLDWSEAKSFSVSVNNQFVIIWTGTNRLILPVTDLPGGINIIGGILFNLRVVLGGFWNFRFI